MKIAVVGTGIIAKVHISAMKSIDDIELVAMCDIYKESAENTLEKYSVPYWTDYKVTASVTFSAYTLPLWMNLFSALRRAF